MSYEMNARITMPMASSMFGWVLAAVLIGVVLHCGAASAAQVEIIDGRYNGERYVSINGPIAAGDFGKVQSAARTAIQQGNSRLALLLNSEGGDVAEAMRIGRLARELLATTYVYGNTLYIPGTPEGEELEQYGEEHSHMRFGLRPVGSGKLGARDIVHCYSACVMVFYGGVSRHVSDNNDYRMGFKQGQHIPVIGIHRPYYEQDKYSALSPSEAKTQYQRLEKAVRDYMHEMGAPTALIDRMFRKASNDVELIPSEQFKEFYHDDEPFIEEWLIARCGAYGAIGALSEPEQEDYEIYRQSLKQAIDSGQIKSSEVYGRFVPQGMTREYIKQLEDRIHAGNGQVMTCRESAIVGSQSAWAAGVK